MNETSFLAASYHLLLVCSSSSTNLTRNILQRFVTVAVSNLPLSLHFIPRGAKLPSLRLLTPLITTVVMICVPNAPFGAGEGLTHSHCSQLRLPAQRPPPGLRPGRDNLCPGPLGPQATTGGRSYLPSYDLHVVPPGRRLRQQQPPQPQLPSGSREAGCNASYAQVPTCPCTSTPGQASQRGHSARATSNVVHLVGHTPG